MTHGMSSVNAVCMDDQKATVLDVNKAIIYTKLFIQVQGVLGSGTL